MDRKRPKIPDQIQRELWGRAAARCEFRGCNKLLYKDGLTQQHSNLAVISHIVSFSPDGPRGDSVRSALLEKNIENLMLTCRNHCKIIDDKALEDEYPESLLLEFKREHEQRICRLTESTEDAQTHVLLLQAPIDGRDIHINPTDAIRAIFPKYPVDEQPFLIDLSGVGLRATSEEFFRVLAASIIEQTQLLLMRRAGQPRVKRLSVFALAPIPLLVHFGYVLGDIAHVDLYQRHRDRQDWTWKEDEEAEMFYQVFKPEEPLDDEREIALLLSVSELIHPERVVASLGRAPLVYEIRGTDPSRDFLRSKKRLEVFGYEVRKLLCELRTVHSHERSIHLFAALPAPLAIEFGRSVNEFDPPFMIYEYQKAHRALVPALTINHRLKGTP